MQLTIHRCIDEDDSTHWGGRSHSPLPLLLFVQVSWQSGGSRAPWMGVRIGSIRHLSVGLRRRISHNEMGTPPRTVIQGLGFNKEREQLD